FNDLAANLGGEGARARGGAPPAPKAPVAEPAGPEPTPAPARPEPTPAPARAKKAVRRTVKVVEEVELTLF
ncbi:MAG: ribonuclease HI, partial [Rhodococcus ruber]|nr:ribonuclease HI [Rhodococcus ruber]